mgnify:CR=1 FL=1
MRGCLLRGTACLASMFGLCSASLQRVTRRHGAMGVELEHRCRAVGAVATCRVWTRYAL